MSQLSDSGAHLPSVAIVGLFCDYLGNRGKKCHENQTKPIVPRTFNLQHTERVNLHQVSQLCASA